MGAASAGGLAGGAGLGLLVASLLAPATGGLSLAAAGLGMGVGGAIGGAAGAAVDANQLAQKTKGQQNALLTQQQQQAMPTAPVQAKPVENAKAAPPPQQQLTPTVPVQAKPVENIKAAPSPAAQ